MWESCAVGRCVHRAAVEAMIKAGSSTREVSAWCYHVGVPVSHNVIAVHMRGECGCAPLEEMEAQAPTGAAGDVGFTTPTSTKDYIELCLTQTQKAIAQAANRHDPGSMARLLEAQAKLLEQRDTSSKEQLVLDMRNAVPRLMIAIKEEVGPEAMQKIMKAWSEDPLTTGPPIDDEHPLPPNEYREGMVLLWHQVMDRVMRYLTPWHRLRLKGALEDLKAGKPPMDEKLLEEIDDSAFALYMQVKRQRETQAGGG